MLITSEMNDRAQRSEKDIAAGNTISIEEFDQDFEQWLMLERHACIDTTAAGGNVALLGG